MRNYYSVSLAGFLVVVVLFSGCLGFISGDRDRGADSCLNHQSSIEAIIPGAWENVSLEETDDAKVMAERLPSPGVPVGPGAEAVMGTSGNITSVKWRPDGGSVWEARGVSWGNGKLRSPEYLQLGHTKSRQGAGWYLEGTLDPERGHEGMVALVVSFLESVRGHDEGNLVLAEEFVPIGDATNQGPVEMGADPPPTSLFIPEVPERLNVSLDDVVDQAVWEAKSNPMNFTMEGWGWFVSVPEASWTSMNQTTFWSFRINPMDHVSAFYEGNRSLGSRIISETEGRLEAFGVDLPDSVDWVLKEWETRGFLCADSDLK